MIIIHSEFILGPITNIHVWQIANVLADFMMWCLHWKVEVADETQQQQLMNESLLSSLAFFCLSKAGPGINYALCSAGRSGLLFRQWLASWSSLQSSCCWPSGTLWGCAASSPGGAAPAPAWCSPRSRCRPAAAACPPPLAPSSCSRWPRRSWLWRTRPASWPEGRAPRAESWTWNQRLKVILTS